MQHAQLIQSEKKRIDNNGKKWLKNFFYLSMKEKYKEA